MKKVIAIIVIALVVIGGIVFAAMSGSNKSTSPTPAATTPTPSTSSSSSSNNSDHTNSAATITYSDNGFSPATLTVKAGTTVTLKNTSSSDVQFDSDPHPVHTDDPELNIGSVSAGQSTTFTPTTTGTHGYHNHLNPSQTGTLIVN